jgi:magnesium transporter
MILANSGDGPRVALPADPRSEPEAAEAIWLDLMDPTEDERKLVERATGLHVPGRAELSEIERSSRLTMRGNVLTLSTPIVSRIGTLDFTVSPLGFVLSRDRLLTVRFAALSALDSFANRMTEADEPPNSGIEAFVGILEAIVDRLADVLELVGADLDQLSGEVFRPEALSVHRVRRQTAELQRVLTSVGRIGDLTSSIRDSLMGVSRIVAYVSDAAAAWTPQELHPRLATLRQDLASLSEYDVQISGKVQFLLDATLGFINIQQNNVIKVLTIASIVGIPPTLIASIYGMNFKDMPELSWSFGYPYGLSMILLSALLPLLWFWWRGWI